jgi:hypothetical protein
MPSKAMLSAIAAVDAHRVELTAYRPFTNPSQF